MRTTQRVNLERLLPSLGALCWRFFRRLTVREPSFEEVVVVYAERGDDEHRAIPQLRLKSLNQPHPPPRPRSPHQPHRL